MTHKRLLSALLLFLHIGSAAVAGTIDVPYKASKGNLEAREAFRDCGLGVFLHWGVYSMFGQGEWYLETGGLNEHEYSKCVSGFYPSRFDAAKWVSDIKASGAGYICITSRHHDGFSMWNTAASDYNIVKATPYGRDILMEISEECHRQGLRFHVYYSLLDWHRTDYVPQGRTGLRNGRKMDGKWETYEAFMIQQLQELVGKYKADCIWFDGEWDMDQRPEFDWHMERLYEAIHAINPDCLVANNHHHAVAEGEDFQIFERDVPGENNAGYSGQEISRIPLETCDTMNGMWGYKISDQNYKSVKALIRRLVSAAGRNANLLMNIGPQANGELPEVAVSRLAELGDWMKTFGPTIKDGARGGDIEPQAWGVTTRKGDKLYLHILDLSSKLLALELPGKPVSVVRFDTREEIQCSSVKGPKGSNTYTLRFPKEPNSEGLADYVVEITLK